MGDKTQLLALVLAARFKRPLPVLAGILVATVFNHGLASYAGAFVTDYVAPDVLRWALAAIFIGFGVWILVPDAPAEGEKHYAWGPFVTTAVVFFFAEMGDKTQLATVALGAKYTSPLAVTAGTTLGMLAADGLAVLFGSKFTEKVSMKMVRRIASALFILFGVGILIGDMILS